MYAQLIIDDRDDASQVIRSKVERRKNKTLFHLLTPFRDSSGEFVTTDRRSGEDRRSSTAK